jgi:hypothetical protein
MPAKHFLLIMMICFGFGCGIKELRIKVAPTSMDTGPNMKYYKFDGYYIDLDNLKATSDSFMGATFKDLPPYAWRFSNPIADSLYINGHSFVIENNEEQERYKLHIIKNGNWKTSVDLPVDTPLAEVREYYIHMFPYKNDVIVYMEDMYTTHYYIMKYNSDGKELMRKDIEHTYVTIEGNTYEHHPYRYFSYLTPHHMVFSSGFWPDKPNNVILSLDDFSVQEYKDGADGIILGDGEKEIAGFISFNGQSKKHTIHMINGKKYQVKLDEWRSGCNVLMSKQYLYIATFHPISTGSGLACFDMDKGEIVWTADVLQVNASHSEYSNNVTLSMYKDKLIMEGNESYGNYVQIFDPKDGKRLASFGFVH